MTNKKSYLAQLIGAVCIGATIPAVAQEATNSEAQAAEMEIISVTVNRRVQSIQDVANSVEAINGSTLDELGNVGMGDFINSIGGAGFTTTGAGTIKLGLRGISPIGQTDNYAFASTVSTVGVYLDDIAIQGAGSLPDLNLYDMQRVEVLKGPQGTLYGDGAMGGAIKMILNKPELDEFEAKGEVTAMQTKDADLGHRIRGALNIPIMDDTLALRIVGSTSDQKGWIDNIATGESDINDTESSSIRATALAQFSENFSAELLFLHDDQKIKGFADEVFGLEENQTNLLEDQYQNTTVDIQALTVNYDLSFAQFTSITSLYEKERALSTRLLLSLDDFFVPFVLYPIAAATSDPITAAIGLPLGFSENSVLAAFEKEETFSQELRLVSSGDNVLDWTVGLFYRDRERDACSTFDSPAVADLNDYLLNTNAWFVTGLQEEWSSDCEVTPQTGLASSGRDAVESFEQIAVYGEINWEMTDELELTAGLRYFEEEYELQEELSASGAFNIFGFSSPYTESSAKEDDVLFKLGLSWKASEDHLYYANIAEGFRSGGTNLHATRTVDPDRYQSFGSDSLINYEIGAKTSWLEDSLRLNGAIYYTDWSDIQASVSVPTVEGSLVSVLTSAGDAEVKGIEITSTYAPTFDLIFGTSINYQQAEFKNVVPGSNIAEGSELPNTPELTASIYAQYTYELDMGDLFARADYRYVDDQRSAVEFEVPHVPVFNPTDLTTNDMFILPSYSVTNLTIGLRTENWYVTGYVNNVIDEDYYVGHGYGQSFLTQNGGPTMATVGTPRTIGLTVGANF